MAIANFTRKGYYEKERILEGMVTSLKFPNKGIVYVEDEDTYVQVKNTLPGQRVRFQLKK